MRAEPFAAERAAPPREGVVPTGEIIAFRPPASEDATPLLQAAIELHALISIDPVTGASPARVWFVFNPDARARIAGAIGPGGATAAKPPLAYAVVTYDFPFALHLIGIAGRLIPDERARTIAAASAALQAGAFAAAADALGVKARRIDAFDAEALADAFFPDRQLTVTDLFRLELRQ